MKKNIFKIAILSGIALAGAVGINAYAADVHTYGVNFGLSNATPICAVYGLPTADTAADGVYIQVLNYSVSVDGAGKITGFASVQVTTSSTTSVIMANVTGSMSTKGTSPVVKMNIKGPGFGSAGKGSARAQADIQFTGVLSDVYPGTLQTVSDGSTYYVMAGKLKGAFDPGIKGAKTVKIQNVDAYITEAAQLTQINSCVLNLVDVNNTWRLGGCLVEGDGNLDFHYIWTGKGQDSWNGKFSAVLTGTDGMKGAQISLKGVTIDDTINPANVGGKIITSLSAKGKAMGQKIDATGIGYLEHQDLGNIDQ